MKTSTFKILFSGLLLTIYITFSGCSNIDNYAGFTIASKDSAITIYIDNNIDSAVLWAVNTFADDIKLITGQRPEIVKADNTKSGNGIYISTLGKPLAHSYQHILPDSLNRKWEAYYIKQLKKNLYLTGSDTRGTIFSIFEISEQIGISPWEWWADVKPLPVKKLNLNIPNNGLFDSPDVQHRGIFINDENWGLHSWATKTFEPETGDIGSKTYEKVFQLLLRLKANTISTAMHPHTNGFYHIKRNREIAAKYHIIVDTFHCESIIHNNVTNLKIPDDAPLIWCDDNYGYITHLSNEKEQKRKGGSGIYYHLNYWGPPHDYLWLSTTQPSLIWTEMTKAYQNGARKIWIANVGNIKPTEYNMEFFLDLAWDINSVNQYSINQHLSSWAIREFGEDIANDVTAIMNEYYRLAFIRKPEFMGWNMTEPTSAPVRLSEFIPTRQKRRIEMYSAIMELCDRIKNSVPESRKDAWFQLVEYPVKSAGYMNQKFMYAQMASETNSDKEQKRLSNLSKDAFDKIKTLTNKYNNEISNGKWKDIMSMHPRNLSVFKLPDYTNSEEHKTTSTSYKTKISTDTKRLFINGDENTSLLGKEGYEWSTVEGLGYSGNAITLMPLKMKTFKKKSPRIEYSFFVDKPCMYEVQIRFLPTYSNLSNQQISIRINRSETKYFNLNTKANGAKWNNKKWCINKLRNSTIIKLKHSALKPGKQIVSIRVNQTGIIIDQLAVDFTMNQPFYEIPAE